MRDTSDYDIPPWVKIACRVWGAQKRRAWSGKSRLGDIDGYAESIFGKIKDERVRVDGGGVTQRAWEVYRGEGLDVQRVLGGLPELPYATLHVQYVFDPEWHLSGKKKARLLGISRTMFYQSLVSGEFWVWSRLEMLKVFTETAEV